MCAEGGPPGGRVPPSAAARRPLARGACGGSETGWFALGHTAGEDSCHTSVSLPSVSWDLGSDALPEPRRASASQPPTDNGGVPPPLGAWQGLRGTSGALRAACTLRTHGSPPGWTRDPAPHGAAPGPAWTGRGRWSHLPRTPLLMGSARVLDTRTPFCRPAPILETGLGLSVEGGECGAACSDFTDV